MSKVSLVIGKGTLLAKKFAPELMLAGGLAAVGTSFYFTVQASRKVDELIDSAKEDIEIVKEAEFTPDEDGECTIPYPENEKKMGVRVLRFRMVKDIAVLYAPAITTGAVGVGLILASYGILKKRNVALFAAYDLVDKSYKMYRSRVVDELGKEADLRFKNGAVKKKETQVNEKGKEVEVETYEVPANVPSQYSVTIGRDNYNWERDYTKSDMLHWLLIQQNFANDLLHSRGHVFLNEIHDALGMKRTTAGQVVGWIRTSPEDRIDFNIQDLHTITNSVEDYENETFILDFNVDGIVYDLVK